jgi:hypothetical protein
MNKQTDLFTPDINSGVFNISANGDVVTGDHIEFERDIWGGTYRNPKHLGTETIQEIILRESYGLKKQQHTFTLLDYAGNEFRIKGRNIYKYGVKRKQWKNEEQRIVVANEKHSRGADARNERSKRIYNF